jgi:excisionase family DNA binding protein
MRRILDEEYVTIPEAAKLLQVHPSSIRRWIDAGDLPAHRVGRRRIVVKRTDLANLVMPARAGQDHGGRMGQPEALVIPKLTPEEQQQALEAMEAASKLRAAILAKRGGKLFSPSWELLNEARDERTRQLS